MLQILSSSLCVNSTLFVTQWSMPQGAPAMGYHHGAAQQVMFVPMTAAPPSAQFPDPGMQGESKTDSSVQATFIVFQTLPPTHNLDQVWHLTAFKFDIRLLQAMRVITLVCRQHALQFCHTICTSKTRCKTGREPTISRYGLNAVLLLAVVRS